MALQQQDFHIQFKKGMDRASDPILSLPAKLRTLLNATFEPLNGLSGQSIVMRGGTSRISTDVIGTGVYSQAQRIFAHADSMLFEMQNGAGLMRSISDGITAVTTGQPAFGIADPFFLRGSAQISDVGGYIPRWSTNGYAALPQGHDCAISGDGTHTCWAWEEKTTHLGGVTLGIRVVVIRESDKTLIYSNLFNTGFGVGDVVVRTAPRVVWVAEPHERFYVYFAAWDEGDMQFLINRVALDATDKYAALTGGELNVFTSSVGAAVIGTLAADLPLFDVGVSPDSLALGLVVRDCDAGQTLTYAEVEPDDGANFVNSATEVPGGAVDTVFCVITSDGSQVRTMGLYRLVGGGGVLASTLDFGTSAMSATAATVGNSGTGRVAAYDQGYGQSVDVAMLWDGGTAITNPSVGTNTCAKDLGGATPVSELFSAGYTLHGRPAYGPGSLVFCTLVLADPLGSTVFVVPVSRYVGGAFSFAPAVVRIAAGEVGYFYEYYNTHMRLPAMLTVPDTNGAQLIAPVQRWVADLRKAGASIITPLVQSRVDIDFRTQLGNLEVHGLSILAGGCPEAYDGLSFSENTFHHPPVLRSASAVAGADNFTAGTHYVIYCEEWQDSQGRLHQGPPSNALPITVAGANDTLQAVVTGTRGQKAGVQLVPYLTTAAGGAAGPFYRAYSITGAGLADTDLAQGDPLYTSGGSGEELPNDPIQPHRQSCVWQNRVWLAGGDDGSGVYFSKGLDPAFPPAFSSIFHRRAPTAFGRVVSVQPLGDRLVVICEKKIGFIYGSGPTATGEQDGYSEILPLIETIGGRWSAPLSSIVAPEGVWFQSQFGLRLITVSGQLARDEDSDVGSELDLDIGASDNLTAVASTSKQQLRFYSSGAGCCFVWDEQWKQWSRFAFTTGAAPSACTTSTTFYHLSDDSFIYQYDDALATDNDASYSAQLITNPIQLAGIQGFQRLYRMLVLGQGVPADVQTVLTQGAFDYGLIFSNLAASHDFTLDSSGMVQFEIHMTHQKSQSFSLSISWRPTASANRMRLIDLALRVGVKRDHAKVASSKRVS